MPSQSRQRTSQTVYPGGTPSIWFKGVNDTTPLEYEFFNEDSSARDVSELDVYFTLAHTLNSPYFQITDIIIDRALCSHKVGEPSKVLWFPEVGALHNAGLFQFQFELHDTETDLVETYFPLSYDYLRVQAPVGGSAQRVPLTEVLGGGST